MRRRKTIGLAAFGAVAALVLAACGGSSGSSSSGSSSSAGYNAATTSVVNPSTHKGGTLTFGDSSTPDSMDPGNTYYDWTWDFTRLYTMPLMTYKSCPGKCGLKVVPDLATGPGVVSDNGLTWTYQIQPNVKFEDGSTVTSPDVKSAVEPPFARSLFPLGPAYFPLLLAPQKPAYPGPYKDRAKNLMGLNAVQTPDPTTILFHLAAPCADFRGGALLRPVPVPARPRLLPVAAGAAEARLSRPLQGPGQEPDGPERGPDAGPDHDRVPSGGAVRGLRLRGRDTADRPGPGGQGHRRELPAAPDVHRPVQVPELPAQQAADHGAEHLLEPGHRPEREAAGQQGRPHPEHERQRYRQPAAGRRPGRRRTGYRRAGGGPGQDPVLVVAQGHIRRPDRRVHLVRRAQHHAATAEQPALPDGDRVRRQQDQLPDRLRWPGGGRRDRDHGGAAERGRPAGVRPLQRDLQAKRRHGQGQGGTQGLRAAERL